MACTFIVEGWSDHDQVKLAFPTEDVDTIVTNGINYNNRLRQLIGEKVARGDAIFILSDPDESGDQLAKMICKEYDFPRIHVDPTQAQMYTIKRIKYGVEYCSVTYLKELLTQFIKIGECL